MPDDPARQTTDGRPMLMSDLPDLVRSLGGAKGDVTRAKNRLARMSEAERGGVVEGWFKVEETDVC